MSKNTRNVNKAEQAKKIEKTNEEHLSARMKDIVKILKLNVEGKDVQTIASKVRVGVTYAEEVIRKGAETMESELRAGYGMSAKGITQLIEDITADPGIGAEAETVNATSDNSLLESATETNEEKTARKKAEKKAEKAVKKAVKESASGATAEAKSPKEKRTRENAILKVIGDTNGTGSTLEEIGTGANAILNIDRKSWTGTLGAMKRANEITYNKETKRYNLP